MAVQAQKILKVAAIALLFLAGPFSARAQETCEPFQDVPVNVIPVFDAAGYDFSTDIKDIQKLAHDTGHSIHEAIVLGVTRYEPTMELSTPVQTVTLPDGTSCARVTSAKVTFGYRNVVVYIAHEIPEGSCGFNEVMTHEQKHIAVNRLVLQEYIPIIRQKFAEYLKNNGMFREEDSDYAMSLLKDKLNDILSDLGGQMLVENEKRQKDVDSPEEYNRISASCNGQLTDIAFRARESSE